MNPENQQKIQQKYMELQTVGQQMQAVQKQLQLMKQHLVELDAAAQAVEDISKTEKGTEMLMPVTSGIFVKGELKDSKNLIVNVGAGTAVTKTAEESKGLEKQSIPRSFAISLSFGCHSQGV